MLKQRMHQTISDKHRLFSACGSLCASVGSFLVQSWTSVYGIINSDIVKGFYYR